MTTVLLAGILAAFVAVTVAAGLRRAPTRARCPQCGTATESVQLPPWMRKSAPELRVRWCPACAWEGVGREGAEMIPGRPVAHGSGFRWGMVRFQEDFGFRFADGGDTPPDGPPAEPPAHPSGFRFAGGPESTSCAQGTGFTWRSPEVPMPTGPAARSEEAGPDVGPGFRWRERPPEGAPVFYWKS